MDMLRSKFKNLLRHGIAAKFHSSYAPADRPCVAKRKAQILRETRQSRAHLTPEIALHLITPECRLFHASPTNEHNVELFKDPFWAFYWPGGQAISRYLLDNGHLVRGKSVLDVGSGCGASSLAALKSGAKSVIANDIDQIAEIVLYLNADLNGVPTNDLKFCASNLIESQHQTQQDIILLGDLFYDEEFAASLLPWLMELRAKGKEVLIGDPGRHGLTDKRRSLLHKLATYELTDNCCIENNGFRSVHVWKLK